MKKSGGSEFSIIIGPSKSVLVYAFHSLEYVRPTPCPISGVRAKIIIIIVLGTIFFKDLHFVKTSEEICQETTPKNVP